MEVTSIFYFHQSLGLSITDAAFYYTISETVFSTSNALSGISFGRYVDKTRRMRFVFLLNIVILCIGNLMYSIPYALWWVLVGRFLCGINESLQTTVCGELLWTIFICLLICLDYQLIDLFFACHNMVARLFKAVSEREIRFQITAVGLILHVQTGH